MKIIGILGLIGSGKSTVGNIIADDFGYKKASFANSLKDATAVLFDWPRHLLEGDTHESREFREKIDMYWSRKLEREITPRIILQEMGTEVIRNSFHNDFWIHSLFRKIEYGVNLIITDVRFPNEIDAIGREFGILIRVKRGEDPDWFDVASKVNLQGIDHVNAKAMEILYPRIHPSEWAWVGTKFDFVIENDGNLEDLKQKVNMIMRKIQ